MLAKEFFGIIDSECRDNVTVEEITRAMMCLGITSDSTFIKRVLCSASAKKFPICVLGATYADKTVSCKEFLRLFRQDLI